MHQNRHRQCNPRAESFDDHDRSAADLGCGATQLVLNGFSSQGAVNYQWTTVGGNIISGLNTPNATINQAGTYTLTATHLING